MKFSKAVALTALTASTALAAPAPAPAAVTVTEHVHQSNTITVEGYVYYEQGQLTTTYVTYTGGVKQVIDTPSTSSQATITAQAKSSSKDAVQQTTTPTTTQTAAAQAAVTVIAKGPNAAVIQTTTLPPTNTNANMQTYTSTATKTSTTGQATESINLGGFASSMLSEHNKKRELHQNTPDLSWSNNLASYAQNYADKYDCSGNLAHSSGKYGENLAVGFGTTGAVDAWYNEIRSYDYSNPGFSGSTGHFTQVVWKSTSQVGCGVKSCGGAWGDYVVCSYEEAGNFAGQYTDNVQPLK